MTIAAVLALILTVQHGERASHRPVQDPYLVLAIVQHESSGQPGVCRDDRGGSSRGLMQIWHPDSACEVFVDEKRFEADYDPATNIREGIRLLVKDRAFHLAHCKHPHDWLSHYAGAGKDARQFARDVRRLARELRRTKGKR